MDKDIIKGKARQAEGRVQNVAGAATDNLGQEIAGKVKQAAGKVQEEFGKAKDDIRAADRRANEV